MKIYVASSWRNLLQPAIVVHPEHRCEKCGGQNITWFVASPLWNTYVRSKGHPEILCPPCFVKIAEAAGYDPAWQLVPENPHDVACEECGQSINPPADVGREYRCKTCGQNTVHDEPPAAPAQSERITADTDEPMTAEQLAARYDELTNAPKISSVSQPVSSCNPCAFTTRCHLPRQADRR